MKNELLKIKADAENNGMSARRIQCRLMDAVKKAGMVTDDGLPTLDARNLVREVLGRQPVDTTRGLHGLTK